MVPHNAATFPQELRSLTPWNWDTKSAKHPPGQAALRDFERVGASWLSLEVDSSEPLLSSASQLLTALQYP